MRGSFAELGRAVQSELLFNVRLVCFDRFHAQVQFSRQSRGAKTTPYQGKHLQLAIAKRSYFGARRLNLVCRQAFQQTAHHACARIEMTVQDPIKRSQDLGRIILEREVSVRPSAKSALNR